MEFKSKDKCLHIVNHVIAFIFELNAGGSMKNLTALIHHRINLSAVYVPQNSEFLEKKSLINHLGENHAKNDQ